MRTLATKRFFFLWCTIAVLNLVISCTKDPDPEPTAREEQKLEGLAYGTNERQRMDIYLPAGRDENTPVVVLLHGGTWVSGDKSDFAAIQQQLLAKGIASVNMNYRYIDADNNYTGLMADVGAALGLMADKAGEWGIRSRGFHLAGASAGGYMALLYGYAFSEQDEIRSVLSIAGPVGISAELLANPATAPLLREPIEWLVGAPIPTSGSDPNLQKYVQASPSTYVNQALPTLLIHGTDDELVPFGMVEAMKASLDGAGIHNTLVELAGARHNFTENPIHALMALNAVFDWISAQ